MEVCQLLTGNKHAPFACIRYMYKKLGYISRIYVYIFRVIIALDGSNSKDGDIFTDSSSMATTASIGILATTESVMPTMDSCKDNASNDSCSTTIGTGIYLSSEVFCVIFH